MPKPGVGFTVEGFEALDAVFAKLPDKVRDRALRPAVQKGSTLIKREGRKRATDDTGLLRESLGVKTVVKVSKYVAFGVIGARVGIGLSGGTKSRKALRIRANIDNSGEIGQRSAQRRDPANYAHLVEFGTKPHRVKTKKVMSAGPEDVYGVWVRGTRPHPFMRIAFHTKKRAALSLIGKEAWDGKNGIKRQVLALRK